MSVFRYLPDGKMVCSIWAIHNKENLPNDSIFDKVGLKLCQILSKCSKSFPKEFKFSPYRGNFAKSGLTAFDCLLCRQSPLRHLGGIWLPRIVTCPISIIIILHSRAHAFAAVAAFMVLHAYSVTGCWNKKQPKFFKHCPKNSLRRFYVRVMFFRIAQNCH